ncbi:hypothetical protein HYU06_04405 [Candidatus Woesearchaeota archaeon]|nr:hypothetical protein [Candidatus Woesearchaeota archaeon]
MRARNVDKHKYVNYLKKAEEFYEIMNEGFAKSKHNIKNKRFICDYNL